VIASEKQRYWADLLRTLAHEDNITALWKKNDGVACYIQRISDMFSVNPVMLV
jgi:hypothetical protein